MSKFPPIAEYAFLSDCEASGLVSPDGCIEWLCLPRPDSPSVFGALLDRSAGFFGFSPSNVEVPHQRRYLPGTNVLETSWHTPTGWLTVTDLLVVGPSESDHRAEQYRRVPGDSSARGTLLRIARCESGRVEVVANCLPLFDYGRVEGEWVYEGEGYDRLTIGNGALALELVSSLRLGFGGARAYGRTMLADDDSAFIALCWGGHAPTTQEDADHQLHHTERFWRDWLAVADVPDHRWRPYMERSTLALKGLSYAPTGAILAAGTTSLPETPGGERNWDYRYTWIRDSAFMLRALHALGFDWEAFEYFAFLLDAVRGDGGKPATLDGLDIQIMYGIGGERDLTEQTLDHLSGYRDSRPVRVGNGAFDQHQHDVWGMLLDSITTHVRNGGQIAPALWAAISYLVEQAIKRFPEPDQGIWEMRGEPKHFVASKVMCWIAVERGVRLAKQRGDHDAADKWQAAGDSMRAEVLEKGVNADHVFRQHYDTDELDASLLLIPIMGFLPPDDERVKATVLAIADHLTKDDLVLRYRVDTTDDGLSGEEGTFTICSFWLVSGLAMIGEVGRSRALFEKLLSFAGPLLLYAEEIDTSTGQHLGNFPQAFTHLSLIDAAQRLIVAEREAESDDE
jgi:GH15 family glucan-1,4-alpha-glucosidase